MFNLGSESTRFYYSGLFGALLAKFVATYFSRLGGFIIFITLALLSFALVTETLLSLLFANSAAKLKALFAAIFKPKKAQEITCGKDEGLLYEYIGQEAIGIDDLVQKSSLPSNQVLNLILKLQLRKLIKVLPGKQFMRN